MTKLRLHLVRSLRGPIPPCFGFAPAGSGGESDCVSVNIPDRAQRARLQVWRDQIDLMDFVGGVSSPRKICIAKPEISGARAPCPHPAKPEPFDSAQGHRQAAGLDQKHSRARSPALQFPTFGATATSLWVFRTTSSDDWRQRCYHRAATCKSATSFRSMHPLLKKNGR